MAWYEFTQNNTGGSFEVNDDVTHRLFIEADTKTIAEEKAFRLGVYYNGVDDGIDCGCCGDRWYGCDEVELPHYSGADTVEESAQWLADQYGWCEPDARIFYCDGRIKEIYRNKE